MKLLTYFPQKLDLPPLRLRAGDLGERPGKIARARLRSRSASSWRPRAIDTLRQASFCGSVTNFVALFLIVSVCTGCAFVVRFPAFSVPKSKNPNLFRGVYHVHTEFSHDSKATLERVINTAQRAGLDFVVVTDHNTLEGREVYQRGNFPKSPLLIFGNELSTPAGHLVALPLKEEPPDTVEKSQGYVDEVHRQGGKIIVAHPYSPRKPWSDRSIQGVDGVEIFSFPGVYYTQDIRTLIPKAAFLPPFYFLRSVLEKSEQSLELWDELLKTGKIPAFGAIDAHLKWEWFGFAPENYLLYFQAVTMYVRAEELGEEKITDALVQGRSFVAFEAWGPASDFEFWAEAGGRKFYPGDSVPEEDGPILFLVRAPRPADIRLIHRGELIEGNTGAGLEKKAYAPGAYRVEVYWNGQLWIVSNPIYVEKARPAPIIDKI